MRNRPNIPATSVSLCISTGPAAGSGKSLSSSPHPGGCFTHTSRSPYFPKFLWSLTRPANLSCVPWFPVPFVRVPGIQGLDFPAVSAIQLSAPRDRCFTSPQQGPCPVNLGSMRASGGTWRPYPRRCGDQARLTRLLWWQHSLRPTHNPYAFAWLCIGTIPFAAKPKYDDALWG